VADLSSGVQPSAKGLEALRAEGYTVHESVVCFLRQYEHQLTVKGVDIDPAKWASGVWPDWGRCLAGASGECPCLIGVVEDGDWALYMDANGVVYMASEHNWACIGRTGDDAMRTLQANRLPPFTSFSKHME
jgi:hypothetical protein